MLKALPILFLYLDKYIITEQSFEYSSNVSKFIKSFFSRMPILNKLSFVFNERGLYLEVYKIKIEYL